MSCYICVNGSASVRSSITVPLRIINVRVDARKLFYLYRLTEVDCVVFPVMYDARSLLCMRVFLENTFQMKLLQSHMLFCDY